MGRQNAAGKMKSSEPKPRARLPQSQLIANRCVSQFTSSLRRLTYEGFHGCPERRVCHECFFYVCACPKLLPSFRNSDRRNNQARREGLRRRAGGVAAFRDLWSRFECRVFLNFNELTARNRIAEFGCPILSRVSSAGWLTHASQLREMISLAGAATKQSRSHFDWMLQTP